MQFNEIIISIFIALFGYGLIYVWKQLSASSIVYFLPFRKIRLVLYPIFLFYFLAMIYNLIIPEFKFDITQNIIPIAVVVLSLPNVLRGYMVFGLEEKSFIAAIKHSLRQQNIKFIIDESIFKLIDLGCVIKAPNSDGLGLLLLYGHRAHVNAHILRNLIAGIDDYNLSNSIHSQKQNIGIYKYVGRVILFFGTTSAALDLLTIYNVSFLN